MRWEQKSGTRGDSRVCHWYSYLVLTFSVIDYWTDALQHGIYLFYIIKEQLNHYRKSFFLFQNLSTWLESRPLPTLVNKKKAIWRNLLSVQNKAISLVAMGSKELWLVQENHANVKPDLSVKLGRCFECYRSRKNTLRKLTVAVNGRSIKFEFWMKEALATVENLCPLWLEILRSLWYSVGDTL